MHRCRFAGVLPDSQEAYELAKEGTIKPKSRQGAMIYSARMLTFKPPVVVIGKDGKFVKI